MLKKFFAALVLLLPAWVTTYADCGGPVLAAPHAGTRCVAVFLENKMLDPNSSYSIENFQNVGVEGGWSTDLKEQKNVHSASLPFKLCAPKKEALLSFVIRRETSLGPQTLATFNASGKDASYTHCGVRHSRYKLTFTWQQASGKRTVNPEFDHMVTFNVGK